MMLDCFERKIRGDIYDPVLDCGFYRGGFNGEVYRLNKNIHSHIGFKRLKWAGHIIRMEEKRISRKELGGHFSGKIMVGRPRVRWEEIIKRTARNTLYVKNWRMMARR